MEISKNKIDPIAKDPIRCKLVNDDVPIEQVMDLDYLGCKISN